MAVRWLMAVRQQGSKIKAGRSICKRAGVRFVLAFIIESCAVCAGHI